MLANFYWSESHMTGCLWRFIKGILFLTVLLAIAGFVIYHTTWFQKKYLYPLPHQELVYQYAKQNNIDPYLVFAVMRAESKYLPHATSVKGARGLMQIMPETGAWIAGKLNKTDYLPSMLYDPVINIQFGTWYLSSLREEFDGNLVLTLAAYNGGRGNVKQWKQQYRWPADFSNVDQIPFKETRVYVAKVLTSYDQYKKLYGNTR
jgi:soluble lytic murein transglycosylase